MKKITSVVLTLVLVAAMLFTLAGCSLFQDTETPKFYGVWKTDIDLTEQLNAELGTDPDMGEYLQISDFTLVYQLTFNEDGTYSTAIDEFALEDTIEVVKADLVTGMTTYLEDMAAEYEMSLDEFLELAEMDVEAEVDAAFTDEMFEEIAAGFVSEGNYEVSDGKLFLSAGVEYAVDPSIYEVYEFQGETLVLLESVGGEELEFNPYPLYLTKA